MEELICVKFSCISEVKLSTIGAQYRVIRLLWSKSLKSSIDSMERKLEGEGLLIEFAERM